MIDEETDAGTEETSSDALVGARGFEPPTPRPPVSNNAENSAEVGTSPSDSTTDDQSEPPSTGLSGATHQNPDRLSVRVACTFCGHCFYSAVGFAADMRAAYQRTAEYARQLAESSWPNGGCKSPAGLHIAPIKWSVWTPPAEVDT